MKIPLEDGSGYVETKDNCKQCFGRGAFVLTRRSKDADETVLQPCHCVRHFDVAGQPVLKYTRKETA